MQISVQSAKQNLGLEPAPHVHCAMSTSRIMYYVLISLLPALAVFTYFFGAATLIQFALAAISALFCQALAAFLRNRPLARALKDPSGLVTALLLALTLPPLLPWYYTVSATVFAMLIVRECFGGLGMNIFNPAMSGFIFLVISAPSVFYNTWVSPTPAAITLATPMRVCEVIFKGEDPQQLRTELKDWCVKQEHDYSLQLQQKLQLQQQQALEAAQAAKVATTAADAANTANADANTAADETTEAAATDNSAINPNATAETTGAALLANNAEILVPSQASFLTVDSLTGATFLESTKTARKAGNIATNNAKIDFLSPSFIAYTYLAGAYLLGGLFLIFTHVIRFQVPLVFLVTIAIAGAAWHHLVPSISITALEHVLLGGTLLGAFYIITDPVTTCGTGKGRLILSVIIALLVILLRVHGSYSDSVAFAVMLGNCLAPLIDVLTKRRPFGIGYRKGGLD